jgi:GT2 family glycosyltransferase
VQDGPSRGRLDTAAALASLREGQPVVWCETLATSPHGDPRHVVGDLKLSGLAAAPAGIEEVTVEVASRGTFEAETGLRRPDLRPGLHTEPSARRPGFEATIPTDDWLPGTYCLTVRLRDAEGRSLSRAGRIIWRPSSEQLLGAVSEGRPALCPVEPDIGGDRPLGDFATARGWARGPAGVDRVVVEVSGQPPIEAFLAPFAYETNANFNVRGPSAANFNLLLDTRALPAGERRVAITAIGGDGTNSRRWSDVLIDPVEHYREWLTQRERRLAEGRVEEGPASDVRLRVCVVGDRAEPPLERSLERQRHTAWTLEALGEGSLDAALRSLLDDPETEALVLVAPGDSLAPQALSRIASRLVQEGSPDVIYSDDDRLDTRGRHCDPFLKPGWSPELLLGFDYVGPFVALGRAAIDAALRLGSRPIEDTYSLLLRLVDEPLRVERLPEVLCTHRNGTFRASTGEAELLEVARRRGRRVELGPRDERTTIRDVRWAIDGRPTVSVIIPTAGSPDPLEACLRSVVDRTSYEALEVVLVDSGGEAAETATPLLARFEHRIVPFRGERFNFSTACNLGAEAASGEFLVFLNDDTEVLTAKWIELMLAHAQLPTVGVVGVKVLYPGALVQYAGVVLNDLGATDGGWPRGAFAFLDAESSGYRGLLTVARDCAAVSGACMMIPAELLSRIGGWDEGIRVDYGDVDVCLSAREAGQRVVVEPRAEITHRERATRPPEAKPDSADRDRLLARWRNTYLDGDPWSHPEFEPGLSHQLQ